MTTDTSLVAIKGMRDGLLVTLGNADWNVVRDALLLKVEEQPSFFQGARLALDVGGQVLHVAELSALRDSLSGFGIFLWAVMSESPVTENTAQILGLATRIHKPRPQAEPAPAPREMDEHAALWVDRTLRSGVRVEYKGNVVILGDVNPGAEVVAGGSVIVWGRLRGVVHAGAAGDASAVVCALDLAPTQLRIADEIAVSPKRQGKTQPEVVRLKDGQLQAEPWTPT